MGAARVAAGILVTRVLGFVREALVARYFGVGAHADVYVAALRTPNLLQNLLGEQSLSAAFIPVYARLVEQGRERDAGRFAGAVFGLLLAAAGGLALLGILAARPLVTLFTAGFLADAAAGAPVDRFELAVQAVRIIFPMTGILVLSAWSLGVLNTHRRFFLPYMAPALWNASMIAVVIAVGEPWLRFGELTLENKSRLVLAVCWGALVGGALQFGVQLPTVARVLRGFRLSWSTRVAGVREALTAFGPVVASRGVVQLSGYFEQFLASFLAAGALGAVGFAQRLYFLPIGLFAMSVAAAELPELSRLRGGAEGEEIRRVDAGLRQMAFLTLPTVVGYLTFGFLLVGAVYRRGSFGIGDTWLVYLVLAAFTLGLFPTTTSRLLVNVFYARGETRTPARIAVVRVVTSIILGAILALTGDRLLAGPQLPGMEGRLALGAVGLALGSAAAAWLEWALLVRQLRRDWSGRLLPWTAFARMAAIALGCALAAVAVWWWMPVGPPWMQALIVVGLFSGSYLGLSAGLGFPEPRAWLGRLR